MLPCSLWSYMMILCLLFCFYLYNYFGFSLLNYSQEVRHPPIRGLCHWLMIQLKSFFYPWVLTAQTLYTFPCVYVHLNMCLCLSLSACLFSANLGLHPLCLASALPTVQCLSFLTVGRLIFYCSEICLANKPLTRQKEGLGHWLGMRDQWVLNYGAR